MQVFGKHLFSSVVDFSFLYECMLALGKRIYFADTNIT
jgi:hypothetical protein